MRIALVLVAGCTYHAGSFNDFGGTFPGEHVTIGCVDLAVALASDPHVAGPLVTYSFGNRCDHRAGIDLASVRVVARDPSGTEHELHAHDPNHELRPLTLPALWFGRETIEYYGEQAQSVCVDIGGIAEPHDERWVCMSQGVPQ